MNIATKIDGYEVQGRGRTDRAPFQCWITSERHRASASLAALEQTGELGGWDLQADHPVAGPTIDRIAAWAGQNGYNDVKETP